MSAQLTYSSLLSDVARYAERDDPVFIAQIPRFIELAEKTIASEFKALWEVRSVTASIEAGTTYVEKPARLRKMISLTINGAPLLERTQEYIAQIATEIPASQPVYWCEYAYKYFGIAPLPNIAYSYQLLYYEQVAPLDDNNQTNLVTSEAPQLLLFGAMLQAAYFLKDQAQIQYWQALYQGSSTALKTEDAQRVVDRNTSFQTQQ